MEQVEAKPAKAKLPVGNVYVRLGLEHLNEGQLLRQINALLAEAYARTEEWEHKTQEAGKFKVNIEIIAEREGDKHMAIKANISAKTPAYKVGVSVVRTGNSLLLCEPDGSYNPDDRQMKLFSARGDYLATVDKETGEAVEEEPATAGKITKTG